MKLKKAAALMAAALLAMALLVGCGGGASSTANSAPAASTPAASGAASTAEPAQNGEPITLEGLAQQLPPLVQASGGLVGLRADQSGNYGTVVKVMDTITAAGGERLALSTDAAGTGNAAGGGP